MSGAIGPGDWVESLIDCGAEYGFRSVAIGSIYCVDSLVQAKGQDACSKCGRRGGMAFLLQGDRPYFSGTGWCACGFRPIYRPKSELLQDLLRKVDTPSELEPV